jgi:vitamin B12 transporter
VTVFSDLEDFHSNLLAVPNVVTRQAARLTLDQKVPTTNVGGMAQWSRALGTKHFFNVGTDWRWTDGDSNEESYDIVTGTNILLKRAAGGTQRSLGAYVQDVFTPLAQLTVTLSARIDNWRNYDGHNLETTVATGQPAPGNKPTLPDREDTVGSPRFAALYRLTDRVNVWGDMSWGFRAPTLNELYRQFRQGTNLVQANENLGPERLIGGEGGVSVELAEGFIVRGTGFDNRVKDPVSNVTLTTTPTLTTQQRQNLGRTRIWGFQTDADYRLGTSWQFTAAYLYNQAKVTENEKNTALVGKYLPQVPSHRGSLQVAYMNPRFVDLALGMQFVGRQFDDDQNIRTIGGSTEPGLPKFAVVDLMASRRLGNNLEAFFGVQNLFDKEYYVGTNPTLIGTPRLVSGGVRVGWSGK